MKKKRDKYLVNMSPMFFQFEVFKGIYVKNIRVKVLVFYFSKFYFLFCLFLKGVYFQN